MAINNADCLVKHTFNKQKLLNMSWYRRLNFLHDLLQSYSNYKLNYSSQLRTRLEEDFKSIWDLERQQKRKLVFYNTITSSFGPEKYIYAHLWYKDLKRIAQFRISFRKYRIETGLLTVFVSIAQQMTGRP